MDLQGPVAFRTRHPAETRANESYMFPTNLFSLNTPSNLDCYGLVRQLTDLFFDILCLYAKEKITTHMLTTQHGASCLIL